MAAVVEVKEVAAGAVMAAAIAVGATVEAIKAAMAKVKAVTATEATKTTKAVPTEAGNVLSQAVLQTDSLEVRQEEKGEENTNKKNILY